MPQGYSFRIPRFRGLLQEDGLFVCGKEAIFHLESVLVVRYICPKLPPP